MKKILLMTVTLILLILGCSKEFHVDIEKEGSAVPNFQLRDLDGKKINSDTILNNGKKTLFVVAADWCPHCRTETPEIQRFYDDYKDKVAKITTEQVKAIAEQKMEDLNAASLEAAMSMVKGTARSMGVVVVD